MSPRLAAAFLCSVFVVASVAVPFDAAAQQAIKWDHGGNCKEDAPLTEVKCTPLFNVSAQAGETITLTITNTCPDDFEYAVVPLPTIEAALQAGKECKGTKAVDIRHEGQYGGYIVSVTKKAGSTAKAGNARITIAVRTSAWKLGFAGGFSVNGLTDPSYSLREIQTAGAGGATVTKYKFIEQDSRKDKIGRSVASFVHLHHSDWEKSNKPTLGISFGLGVEPDRGSDYYAGPSLLFGDRAALTLGVLFGQIKSPPSGREVNDTVTDANTLANLGRRRVAEWFVSLSYRFLGGGADDLKKPFQGESPPAKTGTATAAATTTPPATTLSVAKTAGDSQTVKPGATSAPLKIKAADAPNGTVTWAFESPGNSVPPPPGKANDQGAAEATVKLDSAAVEGPFRVKATVCTAAAPPKCGSTTFELTIKK